MVILLLYSAKLNRKTGSSVNDTNHLSCGSHIFIIRILTLRFWARPNPIPKVSSFGYKAKKKKTEKQIDKRKNKASALGNKLLIHPSLAEAVGPPEGKSE